MKSFTYYNPVKIEFGIDKIMSLNTLVGNRDALLVTSKGAARRNWIEMLETITGRISAVIDDVTPNPTFSYLRDAYRRARKAQPGVIIALGGGSVIDAAKALSVYNEYGSFSLVDGLIRKKTEKWGYRLVPVIAIPTTAGTGSEVTPWATVWDMGEKKKYSLHLKDLWCECALCDPKLTLSMPLEVTVYTALDALSHSLEAIWNKNANPVSTGFAVAASKEIVETLPELARDLDNSSYREKISYYVTANKGVSHGIACSFSLPDIIDCVAGQDEQVDSALAGIFGEASSNKIRAMYKKLNISPDFSSYGISNDEIAEIKESLSKTQRAGNSLVDSDKLFSSILVS